MRNLLILPLIFCCYSYGLGQTAKDFYEAGVDVFFNKSLYY
jgi:hypothetical protein